jgi:hypothetical protein
LLTTFILSYIPAVPGVVPKFRKNSKLDGNSEMLVKITTHNSNEPTSSSTLVKFVSNPTRIAT